MEETWAWYQLIILLLVAGIIVWRIWLYILPRLKEKAEEKAKIQNLYKEKDRLLGKRKEIQFHIDWATYNNDIGKANNLVPSLDKIQIKISEIDATLLGKKSLYI